VTDWGLRQRASLAGGKVAWDRLGGGSPIVLVHGTPGWSYLWRKVAPVLAQRFSVYLVDLLGYGDSERREDQDISITGQGRVLAQLLERWSLEAPGLVGHDIGAATVLRAHLVEGRAAGRIALVDAVALHPWNTSTTMHIRAHLDAYRTMPMHIYEEVVKAHLRTAVHRPLNDEALAALPRSLARRGWSGGLLPQDRPVDGRRCRRARAAPLRRPSARTDPLGRRRSLA
jgi:pimeloyl-ACP methyl ester carboxylesterase